MFHVITNLIYSDTILIMMRSLRAIAGMVFILLLIALLPLSTNAQEEPEPIIWSGTVPITSDFYVGENDVFPEQFGDFLGLEPAHLQLFREHHQDLLKASYWRDLKKRHKAGEMIEVLPYRKSLSAASA